MTKRVSWNIGAILLTLLCFPTYALRSREALDQEFDTVILNGRVMDPETGKDEIANVGIHDGKIRAITSQPIQGRRTIDATGLVVSPGFIDILSSLLPEREAHIDKVTDGVTTVFGMHDGPIDVERYHQTMEKAAPLINFGRAVGHGELRLAVGVSNYASALPEQIGRMQDLARRAIRSGAAGIGFGINYTPGATYEEIHAMFQVCASEKVSCNLHVRYKGNVFPETMSTAVMEVIAQAAATGAQAEIAHLTSDTIGSAPLCIQLVEGAAKHGVNVAFDFHTWTRSETSLKSALYDPGWQQHYGGIGYGDVYVAATQEQLTKERFEELRKASFDTQVQSESIPAAEIELALRSPISIVSSDSEGLENGKGHPRGRGTFARLLGLYVREKHILSLMDALGKITILPAHRMEGAVSTMKQKGRLQVGCDADITVFDPTTVRERATYKEPDLPSRGIRYVMVNGTLVLDNDRVIEGVAPGRWLRHAIP